MAFHKADWSFETLCLISGLLLAVYFLVSTFRSWYRLRHVPGPFLASVSYLWLARVAKGGKQFWVYREMRGKYGPLIRVGPNELSTDDPEVIRHMSSARSTYGRDPWYLAARFDPYHDNVFTMLEAGSHDKFKSKIAGAYGGRETPALEPGIDDQINALLDLIRRKYLSESGGDKAYRPLEFAELASFFSMDVITRSAFGQEFGYLKTDSDIYDFLAGVRETWPGLAVALDLPWVRNVLFSTTYLKLFGPQTTDLKGLGKLMSVAEEVVAKRFENDGESQKDMLGSFIAHGLTRQECATEALFMIIAGFENTSTVIRTTFLYLMSSHGAYRRFKEVINKVVDAGEASSPITYEEAKRIPYLQAIIYEGLRMRPPAPGLYPKSVPPEGDIIHGKFIPGGTAIGMNTASIMKSTELFGMDADIFRPERFLEVDEVARAEMERNVELVFGYGRWMCAGKPVAFMELNKVFFELANPMKPWDCRSYSQFIDENMWVRVTRSEM